MEKFFRNSLYTGIAIFAILVVVVAWMWDSYRNPSKDFYGWIKPESAAAKTV